MPTFSFETAKEVFLDEARLDELDDEPSEERWRTIGHAAGNVLFVVYTEPDTDVVHIGVAAGTKCWRMEASGCCPTSQPIGRSSMR